MPRAHAYKLIPYVNDDLRLHVLSCGIWLGTACAAGKSNSPRPVERKGGMVETSREPNQGSKRKRGDGEKSNKEKKKKKKKKKQKDSKDRKEGDGDTNRQAASKLRALARTVPL
eukprot:5208346-Pleurochrysis_carterae.AAC.6